MTKRRTGIPVKALIDLAPGAKTVGEAVKALGNRKKYEIGVSLLNGQDLYLSLDKKAFDKMKPEDECEYFFISEMLEYAGSEPGSVILAEHYAPFKTAEDFANALDELETERRVAKRGPKL